MTRTNSSTEARSTARRRSRAPAHRVAVFRQRQALVGELIDAAFGRFAESNPELWERRAYLMLIGIVYERLIALGEEVSTDELAKLAKTLRPSSVAQRSAAGTRVAQGNGRAESGDGRSSLPQHFSEIVRQVYGTSFHDPVSSKARTPSQIERDSADGHDAHVARNGVSEVAGKRSGGADE